MSSASLVWFRDDLRVADNPALRAAMDRGMKLADIARQILQKPLA